MGTGKEVRVLAGHTAYIAAVKFSPDGKYIITGSADNTARLWYVDYREFVAFACSQLSADLSQLDRTIYSITDTTPTCPQFAVTATPTSTPTPAPK